MKAGCRDGVFSHDQLIRASTLIGMFKGLHLLFANGISDRWSQISNRAALLDCKTLMAAMADEGIPMMLWSRLYVDTLSGGIE